MTILLTDVAEGRDAVRAAAPAAPRLRTADILAPAPWPHLVLDAFLDRPVLERALTEIAAETYNFEIEARGEGRIEYSILKSETLWRAIYAREVLALLSHAFGVKLKLNRDNYLQLRQMNDATPAFPLHNDFATGEDTIASFFYLSPGWTPARGGQLHLHASGDAMAGAVVSIDPLQNRFVAFRTRSDHWHSVDRVAGWRRLAVLALWDVEPDVAGA